MLDILIKGARVFDGEIFLVGDICVGVREGKIISVGKTCGKAKRVIDAAGLVLAPGFIDIHSHSEFTVLFNPESESKICQGVTTELVANCGFGPWPCENAAGKRLKERLECFGLKLEWNSLQGYFDFLAKVRPSVNIGVFIGHGNVRASVIGYENRAPDEKEMKHMRGLVEGGMKQGAFGLSTGLMYPPGVYAKKPELIECAKAASSFGGIYVTHMRNESGDIINSIQEALKIGYEANIKVQISHLKVAGRQNWDKIDEVFSLIEGARKSGMDVTCDRYPYSASFTSLDIVLPSWVYEGGNAEEIKRLRNPETRRKLAEQLRKEKSDEYWDRVKIASVSTDKNKPFEGKSVLEIANFKNSNPVEVFFDLLLEESLGVYAIFFNMSEKNLFKILGKTYCMVGSDAASRVDYGKLRQSMVHPRAYGTFPRAAGRFVRDGKLNLEDALYKMTGQPSRKLKLKDRGFIRKGLAADLVLFDPGSLADTATFDCPHKYPGGIKHVIINGTVTVEEGEHTGARAGTVVKSISRKQ